MAETSESKELLVLGFDSVQKYDAVQVRYKFEVDNQPRAVKCCKWLCDDPEEENVSEGLA